MVAKNVTHITQCGKMFWKLANDYYVHHTILCFGPVGHRRICQSPVWRLLAAWFPTDVNLVYDTDRPPSFRPTTRQPWHWTSLASSAVADLQYCNALSCIYKTVQSAEWNVDANGSASDVDARSARDSEVSCYSVPDSGAEYCDQRVCLSVCVCLSVRDHIIGTTRPIFTKFCACYQWPWLGPPLAA